MDAQGSSESTVPTSLHIHGGIVIVRAHTASESTGLQKCIGLHFGQINHFGGALRQQRAAAPDRAVDVDQQPVVHHLRDLALHPKRER